MGEQQGRTKYWKYALEYWRDGGTYTEDGELRRSLWSLQDPKQGKSVRAHLGSPASAEQAEACAWWERLRAAGFPLQHVA